MSMKNEKYPVSDVIRQRMGNTIEVFQLKGNGLFSDTVGHGYDLAEQGISRRVIVGKHTTLTKLSRSTEMAR